LRTYAGPRNPSKPFESRALERFTLHAGRLGQRIHGASVIPPAELARLHGRPVLVSVAAADARAEIRAALQGMGFRELRSFVALA